MKRFLTAAVATATVAAGGSNAALAQDAVVEGPGIQVSEGSVVHPTLGAETGFISNVFYEDANPEGSALLRLLAKLAWASASGQRLDEEQEGAAGAPPRVQFSAGARFAYEEYLSSNERVRDQRNLGIGADLMLGLLPHGTFPFTIEDHFVRTNRPTNFESSRTLNRDINTAKATLGIQPEGRTLAAKLSYKNTIDIFESDASEFANRIQHDFGFRADWQFLPITRFFLDSSLGFYGGLGAESDAYKVSSMPLRIRAGIDTAITENTTVRASGGFGKGFYESGDDFTGALVGVELGYRYSPMGRVTLGYAHDFKDSINANFYSEHMLKLAVQQQIARVMLSADVAGRLRGYRGIDDSVGGGPSRDDVIVSGRIRGSYVLRDWLAINADAVSTVVETDYRSTAGGMTDDPSYTRHAIMLGVTAAL